jgi:hypothetical protein
MTGTLTRFAVSGGTITTPPPIIKAASPSIGSPGDKILIRGFNLQYQAGPITLSISDTNVTEILSWSDNLIECLIPPGAVSGPLVVSTEALRSNDDLIFHISAPPEIKTVSPSSGTQGTLITVQGLNFGKSPPTVTVGGMKAIIQRKLCKYNSLVCTIPRRLATGAHDVTVTTPHGSHTLPGAFTVLGP